MADNRKGQKRHNFSSGKGRGGPHGTPKGRPRGGSKGGFKPGGKGGPKRGKSKPHSGEYHSGNPNEPAIPAGILATDLDEDALKALTTLSGANQEIVARHLVAAGQLLDIDPEAAYLHAQAAVKRAGRVDITREAAALTAYATGRYDEALREVRAVRRMRGEDSLRVIEADAERGLGRPEKALEVVEETDLSKLSVEDQAELLLVAAGARADLAQLDYSLMIVEDALAALPEEVNPEVSKRLRLLQAERLGDLGREDEAAAVLSAIPPEEDEIEIVDLDLILDADVDNLRTDLRGSEEPLTELFDGAILDLDGVCFRGAEVIPGGPEYLADVEKAGMQLGYLTNNSSRSPDAVAEKLRGFGYNADSDQVMTSAMDLLQDLAEVLEPGDKVLVTGSEQLANMVTGAGFEVVTSADDEPVAVVQGLSPEVGWPELTEAALAIQGGAKYYATNLDPKLPVERGFAIGNGSLVAAVSNATGVRPQAAGKPGATIFQRAAERLRMERPIAVGDQLSTDIAGAVAARYPSLHVLTGVSDARDVVQARKGERPSFVALDVGGLNEVHPRPKHHRDGTWTCGVSQPVRIDRRGNVYVGEVLLDPAGPAIPLGIDTYRALIAASWEHEDERFQARSPELIIVTNDDETGVVREPEIAEADPETDAAQAQPEGDAEPGDSGTPSPTTPEDGAPEGTSDDTSS